MYQCTITDGIKEYEKETKIKKRKMEKLEMKGRTTIRDLIVKL